MKINLIACGKINNSPLKLIFSQYCKRIDWKINITEICLKDSSNINANQHKKMESQLILKNINQEAKIIALDEKGKQFSSQDFAKIIDNYRQTEKEICFIIGGAFGLDEEIIKLSHLKLSLGLITLPHLLARIILIEQIYRAKTIIEKHPYHK